MKQPGFIREISLLALTLGIGLFCTGLDRLFVLVTGRDYRR